MIRRLVNVIYLSILFIVGCATKQKCIDGLNLLPMYGRQPKCEEQLKSDNMFFAETDKQFLDRQIAAKNYVDKAWEYFYKDDLATAMKRFNQAWLLDSLNSDTYWGFGNILGLRRQFKESLPLLEKSIELNPENPKVYESIASSYGQLFFETKDVVLLNKSIDNFKKSAKLDSSSVSALAQLTAAYSYFNQKDSAKKYLALVDKLNPTAVNAEVRKMLTP